MLIEPPTGDDFKFSLLGTKNAARGGSQAAAEGVRRAVSHASACDAYCGHPALFETTTPCSYAGMDTYFRLTQP